VIYKAKSEALSSTLSKTTVVTDDGSLKIRTTGFSAHASSPSTGLNAISYLLKFLYKTDLLTEKKGLLYFLNSLIGTEYDGSGLGIDMKDQESGELTLNLGILRYSYESVKATIDIRYPVTADGNEILSRITHEASKYGVIINSIHDSPPLFVKPDHPLIAILSKAYEKITGKKAELLSTGGGTYARTLKNRGVAFGSAEGANYHKADEYVLIDKLILHARICTQAMYEMAVAKLP
jgi:succinyl-diaminopimelate desuccinylase